MKITIELAQRLCERGLFIPVRDGLEYETERLEFIAKRQKELWDALVALDNELLEMKGERTCVGDERTAGC